MLDVLMTLHLTSQSDPKVFLVMMQHKLINLMKMVKSFQLTNQWEPWTRTRTDPGWSRKSKLRIFTVNTQSYTHSTHTVLRGTSITSPTSYRSRLSRVCYEDQTVVFRTNIAYITFQSWLASRFYQSQNLIQIFRDYEVDDAELLDKLRNEGMFLILHPIQSIDLINRTNYGVPIY